VITFLNNGAYLLILTQSDGTMDDILFFTSMRNCVRKREKLLSNYYRLSENLPIIAPENVFTEVWKVCKKKIKIKNKSQFQLKIIHFIFIIFLFYFRLFVFCPYYGSQW